MNRILLLTTAVLVACSIIQVVFSDCVSETKCVPAADCEACRQYKCRRALQDWKLESLDCSKVDPYFGGNQCCDRKFLKSVNRRRKKRQATNPEKYPDRLWSNPVQYLFDTSLDMAVIERVAGSVFRYLQNQTCLRFTRATAGSTTPYMNFTAGSSCTSYVGRSESISSVITLTPQCASSWGQVLYFLLQILGLFHQSQRPDRDGSITINYDNVDQQHLANFAILNPPDLQTTFGLPYDLASELHFPSTIFSKNGNFTILTNDPLYQQTIGQMVEMSFQDAKLINFLYCNASCSAIRLPGTCMAGGYQDPNNCSRCKCPDGFSGQFCEKYEDTTVRSCGGVINASLTEMNISSPGYFSPGYYDAFSYCVWIIKAPKGGNISISFFGDFGVFEDPSYACDHWVEIRFNKSLIETGPRFCGQTRPTVNLVSRGPEAMIIFKANLSDVAQNQRRGFLISFKIVNAPVCAYVTCLNGGSCIEDRCICIAGYTGTQCEIGPSPTTTFPPQSLPSTTFLPQNLPSTTFPSSSLPSSPPTSCSPNPCRNNGTCSSNGGTVTCQCINGFSGPYCTKAPCGGCNYGPGGIDSKCVIPESPPRTCQVQDFVDSTSGWWWSCRRSTSVVYRNVSCTWAVCCDSATDFGYGCGVVGWANWCPCPVSCGGGIQTRVQYGTRKDRVGNSFFVVVATQQQNCNMNKCSCTQTRKNRWWYQCATCNGPDFVESGDQCVPKTQDGGGDRIGG